ncbi:DUF4468 domain-containing protein [Cytophagaceae bacterium ABcell3]|nr:DUF4468 domain-containing protein [Cytophagaceae bacterium ABcell3]
MKKVMLFFLMIMVGKFAIAQGVLPIDEETGKVMFSEVVPVDNNNQKDLFTKARNVGSSKKEDILKDDEAEGIFKTKGKFGVKYPSPMRGMMHDGTVSYTLSIMVKDGRYKYEITDFEHSSPKASGGKLESKLPECGKYTLTESGWSTIKKETKKEVEGIIENLKAAMAKAPAADKDDW